MRRSILFLQGVASPFFAILADSLEDAGCSVYRVNFCGGDRLFAQSKSQTQAQPNSRSNQRQCWDYQDPLNQFPDWLDNKFTQHEITDVVLFGDSRSIHKDAIAMAKSRGISVHVYEEGYFRPNLVTLEQGGVNANSSLPRDPQWYHKNGGTFPDYPTTPTGYSLLVRAWHDIRYHLSSFFLKRHFPHYTTHRPEGPLREYLGWARRFPTLLFHDWNGDRIINKLIKRQAKYYFLPLQLSADTQIRIHSPFNNVTEVIEKTVESFVKNAPDDTLLVIKNHPLDTGLVNYQKIIKQLEKTYGIENRLVYLEDGYLPTMLHHAKGTVLVNSTVGTSSFYHKIPTFALGEAIYDMEGLTFQGSLDDFWTQGTPPDPVLYSKFRNALLHLTQINGDFYSRKGIEMAVQGSMRYFDLYTPVMADQKDSHGIESSQAEKEKVTTLPHEPLKEPAKAYAYNRQ